MRRFRQRRWLTLLGYDRQKLMNFRWYGRAAILLACVAAFSYSGQFPRQYVYIPEDSPVLISRHLLSLPTSAPTNDCSSIQFNASHHGMEWEKCDFELASIKELWVFIHGLGIFIMFVALAIICDDFFVPSLEAISEKLRLSEDVAGATFMAAGSSAPELFTSVVGVAFETDVGVGTIVGSAVFNILIIIALTAALAGQVLSLDWRPIFRDGFYYAISIILFITFSWDGIIELYEAIILLVLYVLYIVIMIYNSRLMDLLGSFQRRSSIVEPTVNGTIDTAEAQPPSAGSAKKMSMTGGHARRLSVLSQTHRSSLHDIQADKHVFHHTHHGGLAGNFTFHVNNGDLALAPRSSVPLETTPMNASWTDLRSAGHGRSFHRQGSEPVQRRDADSGTYHNGRRNSADSARGPSQIIIRPSSMSANFVVTEYLKDSSYTPIPETPTDRRINVHDPDHTTCSPHSYFTFHQHGTSPDNTATLPARHPSVIEERDDERTSSTTLPKSESEIEEEDDEPAIKLIPCLPAIRATRPMKPIKGAGTCSGWLCYVVKLVLFVLSFPFVCLFSWSIPDCSKEHNRKWFLLSFLMSVIWIAVLSVAMVTLVARAGCIVGIDNYTMGLVVVAVGTSVPDALSSILVARDGYGDMAVSNAIGSNVFDIDLGLGLPFIIKIAIGGPIHLLGPFDQCLMDNGQLIMTQHAKFGFILMFILILTVITFAAARFKLNRGIGITFVCIYILFLTYAFVQEFQCLGVYC